MRSDNRAPDPPAADDSAPDRRRLLTVDMDGVICRPILGQNIGIHRGLLDPEAAPRPARVYPRWLNEPADRLRFDFRRPMPGALDAMTELARIRRLVLLTGRRSQPLRWLRRHGFEGMFDRVIINQSAERSPHYKLALVRELGADEHIDDDARTAQLLAQVSDVRVFLCDWPRNRGLPLDPRIERVRDAADLARRLTEAARLDPERATE